MTVDIESNKYYVGRHSTTNLFDGYIGSGIWIKKYPVDKMHRLVNYVLEFFNNEIELKFGEQKLLDMYFGEKLCMNFSDRATGFASGVNNPSNNLSADQIEKRSTEHWSKTDDAKQWFSENNPSKRDSVKLLRSIKANELWSDAVYRAKFSGDNHWTNQDTEAARLFKENLIIRNKANIQVDEEKDMLIAQKEAEKKFKNELRLEKKIQSDLIKQNNINLRLEIKRVSKDKRLNYINSIIKVPIENIHELTVDQKKEVSVYALSIATTINIERMTNRRDAGLSAFTDKHLENLRKPKLKSECVHCNIVAAPHILSRYHNDKCKWRLQ